MKKATRFLSAAMAAICGLTVAIGTNLSIAELPVSAASVEEYPVTLVQITTQDGGSAVSASGTKLAASAVSGAAAQSFRIEYAGADGGGSYFRIINAATG